MTQHCYNRSVPHGCEKKKEMNISHGLHHICSIVLHWEFPEVTSFLSKLEPLKINVPTMNGKLVKTSMGCIGVSKETVVNIEINWYTMW